MLFCLISDIIIRIEDAIYWNKRTKRAYEEYKTFKTYTSLKTQYGSEFLIRFLIYHLTTLTWQAIVAIKLLPQIFLKYRFNENNEYIRDKIGSVIEDSKEKFVVLNEIMNGLVDETIVLYESLFYYFIGTLNSIADEAISVLEPLIPTVHPNQAK